jgi:hypothetical protein
MNSESEDRGEDKGTLTYLNNSTTSFLIPEISRIIRIVESFCWRLYETFDDIATGIIPETVYLHVSTCFERPPGRQMRMQVCLSSDW